MTTENNLQKILQKSPNPQFIQEVFNFAKEAYKNKFRLSGENYIHHGVRVALILSEMDLDPLTIAFGIIHDITDDLDENAKNILLKEVEEKFGKEFASLIEKINRIQRIRYFLEKKVENEGFLEENLKNVRKMFMALAQDLRVILTELVSRLDGLKFLSYLPENKQKIYAVETLKILVPIAGRLGLSKLRRELEDSAFFYLFPEKFEWLKKEIKEEYSERETHLKKIMLRLEKIFKKERVKILEMNYRAKSYWSTYRKMVIKNLDVSQIHDLLALRIIVEDVESCYKALGIIHKYFTPLSEEIQDYIAKPKPTGYRSLHTTIISPDKKITEIQIRTQEMHKEAEYGICAHWAYKENLDLSKEDLEWSKQLKEEYKSPQSFSKSEISFYPNQVFVFTPKGDIIILPKDSTPVDFAYAIHSEIGNHCSLSKVNNKIVSLDYTLENGDVVEIITDKKRKPSPDWLNFVKTNLAKSHIKKFTQKREFFNFPITDFLKRKLFEFSSAVKKKRQEKKILKEEKISQIYLAGQKGILVRTAKCCNPQPGDEVAAYLSQERVAVLHSTSCKNFKKLAEKNPERVIEASWK